MIYVRVWDSTFRAWTPLPDPLPMTEDELKEARRLFREDHAEILGDVPQTRAREILMKLFPKFKSFDLIIAGFAVTNDRIEVNGKRWKKLSVTKR